MGPQSPKAPHNPTNPNNKLIRNHNETLKTYKTPYAKEKVLDKIQDKEGKENAM